MTVVRVHVKAQLTNFGALLSYEVPTVKVLDISESAIFLI
jgi:hypothetical protein